jgi:hypothetical protein
VTVEVPELPDFCWPVDTTCIEDWDALTDPDSPAGEDNPPLYSEAVKARAVSLAGQSMRLLTGFRIGGCPITVRPCRAGCSEATWRTYPVPGFGGSTPWQPVYASGSWLNIGCGHLGGCSCKSTREVRLHGQASAVTEVLIDGVVLDEAAYELRPGGFLARIDGQGWPLCQNLDAPVTEEGTWAVTYTPGLPVDGLGAWAAGILAGQYLAACTSGHCDLPDSVTQVVRQGTTITKVPGAFPDNKTGIRAIDSYLEAVNPNGLQAPPMVWSPDLARPRTT